MPGAAFLQGDQVTLRTIEEADLPFLRDTVNHPDVRRGTGFLTPVNAAQEQEWFESGASGDDSVDLLICVDGEPADDEVGGGDGSAERADTDPSDAVPVGSIGIHPVSSPHGEGELGVFLAPAHWGRGYATDAARALTDYAFDELGKHRVVARVFDYNEASKRVWEKLGFRHEATFVEAAFRDGEYVDTHLYAVLEQEWRDS